MVPCTPVPFLTLVAPIDLLYYILVQVIYRSGMVLMFILMVMLIALLSPLVNYQSLLSIFLTGSPKSLPRLCSNLVGLFVRGGSLNCFYFDDLDPVSKVNGEFCFYKITGKTFSGSQLEKFLSQHFQMTHDYSPLYGLGWDCIWITLTHFPRSQVNFSEFDLWILTQKNFNVAFSNCTWLQSSISARMGLYLDDLEALSKVTGQLELIWCLDDKSKIFQASSSTFKLHIQDYSPLDYKDYDVIAFG